MVIVRLEAGLGNQLFQYAIGRVLTLRDGGSLWLDIGDYSINSFRSFALQNLNVRARVMPRLVAALFNGEPKYSFPKRMATRLASQVVRIPAIKDKQSGFDPTVLQNNSCYLNGFWQASEYFGSALSTLREEFTPRSPLTGLASDLAREMQSENSVAIHVRRGDVAEASESEVPVRPVNMEYYRRAVDLIRGRVSSPKFFVFSDDVKWVEQNWLVDAPIKIASAKITKSAVEDFAAMRCAKHFIIANSTFSWWPAWLGAAPDKLVVAPADWKATSRMNPGWARDLPAPDWLRC